MDNNFISISNNAVFRLSSEGNSTNYLKAFDRLFLTLAAEKEYTYVDVDVIREDFKQFYSLELTTLFINEFVNRLMGDHFIYKQKNDKQKYFNRDKIRELNLTNDLALVKKEVSCFVDAFQKYVNQQGTNISREEAEELLYRYIEHIVCSLSLSKYESQLLAPLEKYIVDTFIKNIKKDNDNSFSTFEKIVYARVYTAVIAQNNLTTGTVFVYKNMNLYLDSGFVFNALGMNYYSSPEEYLEMINNLKKMGAKLHIFEHTFKEMRDLVENAIPWIDSPLYDQFNSSKTAAFFVLSRTTKAEANVILYTLKEKINALGIDVVSDIDVNYNELEGKEITNLKIKIEDEYTKKSVTNEDKYDTYMNDAKSIYYVHKLRNKEVQRKFSDIKHLFVTNNNSLVRISSEFNKEKFFGNGIATAISDSLLSTLIWFESNKHNDSNDLAILIPSVYHALEPSNALLKKMNEVFAVLKEEGIMSEIAIHNWKTDIALQENIITYTKNDPDNFTIDTPNQILMNYKKTYEDSVSPTIAEFEKDIIKIEKRIKVRKMFLRTILLIMAAGIFVGLYFVFYFSFKTIFPYWVSILFDGGVILVTFFLTYFIKIDYRRLAIYIFDFLDKKIINRKLYCEKEKKSKSISRLKSVIKTETDHL